MKWQWQFELSTEFIAYIASSDGGTKNCTITSRRRMIYVNDNNQSTGSLGNWESHSFTATDNADWITTTKSESTVTCKISSNSTADERTGTITVTQDRSGYYLYGGSDYPSDPSSTTFDIFQKTGVKKDNFSINFQAQLGDWWGIDKTLSITITVKTDRGTYSVTDRFWQSFNDNTLLIPMEYVDSSSITYSNLTLKNNGEVIDSSRYVAEQQEGIYLNILLIA